MILFNLVIASVLLLGSGLLFVVSSIMLGLLSLSLLTKGVLLGLLFLCVVWLVTVTPIYHKFIAMLFFIGYLTVFASFLITFRHHSPAFLLGRGLMVANVFKNVLKSSIDGKEYPSKKDLALTYATLELRHLLDKAPDRKQVLREKIFGLDVDFFSYNTLLSLLRKIFVNQEYFMPLDSDEPVIIDCGSNIGASLLFFKLVYPGCKLVAFEADPENFKILQKNVESNKLHDIRLINKAVYNVEKKLTFKSINSTMGKVVEGAHADDTITVDAVLLSNYIDAPVDLLKIDIEGAETAVIEDLATNNKLTFIKNIAMEFHYDIKQSNKLAYVLKTLEDHGFSYQIAPSSELGFSFNKSEKQYITARYLMIYAYQETN